MNPLHDAFLFWTSSNRHDRYSDTSTAHASKKTGAHFVKQL
jgi:hypothetical protein